jgi:hypothetical protein
LNIFGNITFIGTNIQTPNITSINDSLALNNCTINLTPNTALPLNISVTGAGLFMDSCTITRSGISASNDNFPLVINITGTSSIHPKCIITNCNMISVIGDIRFLTLRTLSSNLELNVRGNTFDITDTTSGGAVVNIEDNNVNNSSTPCSMVGVLSASASLNLNLLGGKFNTSNVADRVIDVTGSNAIRLVCSNLNSNVISSTAFMQGVTVLTPLSISNSALY